MVAGVSTGGQVGVISMTAVRYAQPASNEPVMPVRRAQLVYANFRHIQVQPDSRLQGGVPLYKLKILDTLIDHLSPKPAAPRVDAASIDSVITGMSRGLRGAYDGQTAVLRPGPSNASQPRVLPQAASAYDGQPGRTRRTAVEGPPDPRVLAQATGAYRAGFLPAPGAFVDLVA